MRRLFSFVLFVAISSAMYAQSVQRCGGCQGAGGVTCPTCGGYGQISVYNAYYGCNVMQLCPQCAGYRAVVCGRCGGQGSVVVSGSNVSFGKKNQTPPNNNKDGFIYQGTSVKVGRHSYKYYRKDGKGYYWNGYDFIPL